MQIFLYNFLIFPELRIFFCIFLAESDSINKDFVEFLRNFETVWHNHHPNCASQLGWDTLV